MDENSNFEQLDYDSANLSEQQLTERFVQLEEQKNHLIEMKAELKATTKLLKQKIEKMDEAHRLSEQIEGTYTICCFYNCKVNGWIVSVKTEA